MNLICRDHIHVWVAHLPPPVVAGHLDMKGSGWRRSRCLPNRDDADHHHGREHEGGKDKSAAENEGHFASCAQRPAPAEYAVQEKAKDEEEDKERNCEEQPPGLCDM